MVKVESLSDKEKTERNKLRTLTDIAEELYGKEKVTSDEFTVRIKPDNINDLDGYIVADFIDDSLKIRVYSPEKFDVAMKLAEAYEKRVGGEVTLKKDYED